MNTQNKSQEDEFLEVIRATFLDEAKFLIEDFEDQIIELESSTDPQNTLGNIFRIAHSIKGSAATVRYKDLSGFVHVLEDTLSFMKAKPASLNAASISVLLEAIDETKVLLDLEVSETAGGRDSSELIKKLKAIINEESISAVSNQANPEVTPVADKKPQITKEQPKIPSESAKETKRPQIKSNKQTNNLIKIDSNRIDSVMELVGELVVIKSLLKQDSAIDAKDQGNTESLLSLLDKTIRDLYDSALSMRMTSLNVLFMKMKRTVRDLSMKLNKPIEFAAIGENTELDRAIIDQLNNPLLHICRNAIDHGLEDEQERKKRKKPAMGTIKLSAKNDGGSVVIEIIDDGGGIDKMRVFNKAIERNLINKNANPDEFSDGEIFDFLFHPGFSTAQEVTDISGRGVGLDVVKTGIEDLRGQITIESTRHVGTTFRLTLPLTTAITDAILITAANEKYILPMEVIIEFVQKSHVTITTIKGQSEMMEIRGQYIPLIKIGNILKNSRDHSGLLIAVVNTKFGKVGIEFENVVGHNQVVLKSLSEYLGDVEGISGSAILGNGQVGLVIDVNEIFQIHSNRFSGEAA